ncbi:MAG: hypothetical protein ACI9WU_004908 [Myxococcota bacterium]|jgi:hypothetical protein
MGAIFGIGFLVLAGVALAKFIQSYTENQRERWRSAASGLGVEFVQGGFLKTHRILGEVDGVRILVDTYSSGSGNNQTTYTRFRAQSDTPNDLTLKREGLGSSFKKLFAGEDIQVADEPFDNDVVINGNELTAVALLGSEARAQVTALLAAKGKVQEGEVYWQTSKTLQPAEMVDRGRQLIRVARALSTHGRPWPDLLLRNSKLDPRPSVRARNLVILAEKYPATEQTAEAIRAAANDMHPLVRLEGATRLGPAGIPALADLTGPQWSDNTVRARAVYRLGRVWPHPEAIAAVERALGDESLAVRTAAIRVAGGHAFAPALDIVLAAAQPGQPSSLLEAAAKALPAYPGLRAEAALVTLLGSDEDTVKTLAALGLARIGGIAAVEALEPHTSGFFTDGELKNAAVAAVEAIQERAGAGAIGGGLSLAEPPGAEGAVSLTEPPGQLTLAEPADF